ncbi:MULTISPECIES: sugar transferase [Streptomyces]|uniref:Sugar transferase n=2 Tax=Streptomyces TaxID=1883 RepID=A0A3R7ERS4_9ACTN|nr:UDP-phosphate galactose phosphotransferase [Streptomyces fradiae]OFA51943.1 UDP-phosphate galactose phosphotransferase [Streptomyces fradiae]PQM23328.1 sugar transferase [Streptomyces xinghaiensis]RKM94892.1 sugar transferase [Streptomyces xinghaiensis]RNC74669.1 sugar transferase [Streptomyces xinghaiensis]
MPVSTAETAHRPPSPYRQARRGGRTAKRAIDVLGAAVLLLLVAPVLLAAAIAVKVDTPGPLLFRQRRTGWRGKEFEVLKLRTMGVGAERLRAAMSVRNEADGHLFKIREDPRVTAVGRWLRRYSLDELPQLVNVLKGQMSLVGPRPLPVGDSAFTGEARRRLLVRPGLTGLWQISGRSDLAWEDALRLDLEYVDAWSVRLDLMILLRTLPAVLRGDGAY